MVRHLAALSSMANWICPEVESTVRFNGAGSGAAVSGVIALGKVIEVGDAEGAQEVSNRNIRVNIFFMKPPNDNSTTRRLRLKKVPAAFRQRELLASFYYGVAVAVGVEVAVAVAVAVDVVVAIAVVVEVVVGATDPAL